MGAHVSETTGESIKLRYLVLNYVSTCQDNRSRPFGAPIAYGGHTACTPQDDRRAVGLWF
jgi:hypothetical protein